MSDLPAWLADLEEETALAVHEPVHPAKEGEAALERLEQMGQRVYERSLRVCEEVMSFADVPYGTKDPPQEWIDQLGEEAAHRKLRLIQAGQMNQKDAPSGVKTATLVLTGMLKAKAIKDAAPQLNVAIVNLGKMSIEYEEQKVDE